MSTFAKTIRLLFFLFAAILIAAVPEKSSQKPVTVYVFLSESCPICQSYTITLKDLYRKYHPKNVNFIGVFPNYDSDPDSVAAFRKKYNIPFGLVTDKNGALTKHFKATITPEVFVENSGRLVLYSGRIDDAFYSLGKRRNVVSTHDLDDALNAITAGQKLKPQNTEAVGCLITVSK
ncbi:MAG: redoxin family protein [Bacteroidia bacterium]